MPRDVAGNYTLPAGNPVVTATIISSTWANNTMTDLATAMTNSLDRTGTSAGMTGQFKAAAGTAGAPGISWQLEPASGWYRNAVGDFRYAISGTDLILLSGTGAGLVVNAPSAQDGIQILAASTKSAVINFRGNAVAAGVGFLVGMNGSAVAFLNQKSAANIVIQQAGVTAVTIGTPGNVIIAAPSSGAALAVTGVAATDVVDVNLGSGASVGVNIAGDHANGPPFVKFTDTNGSPNTWDLGIGIGDATAGFVLYDRTGGRQKLKVFTGAAAPIIQAFGPVANALVDMTPDSGSFSTTTSGAFVATFTMKWRRIGGMVWLWTDAGSGAQTPLAQQLTCNSLPSAIQPAATRFCYGQVTAYNGSSFNCLALVTVTNSANWTICPMLTPNAGNPGVLRDALIWIAGAANSGAISPGFMVMYPL